VSKALNKKESKAWRKILANNIKRISLEILWGMDKVVPAA